MSDVKGFSAPSVMGVSCLACQNSLPKEEKKISAFLLVGVCRISVLFNVNPDSECRVL